MKNNEEKQELCDTHKKEINRFCRSCQKLMCVVCRCEHFQPQDNYNRNVISDINLRNEAEGYIKEINDFVAKKQKICSELQSRRETKILKIREDSKKAQESIISENEAKIQAIILKSEKLKKEAMEKAEKMIKEATESATKQIESANAKKQWYLTFKELETDYRVNLELSMIQDIKNHLASSLLQKDFMAAATNTLKDCIYLCKIKKENQENLHKFDNVDLNELEGKLGQLLADKSHDRHQNLINFRLKKLQEWKKIRKY